LLSTIELGGRVEAVAVSALFFRGWHYSARASVNLDSLTTAAFAASDPSSEIKLRNPFGPALVVRIAPGFLQNGLGHPIRYLGLCLQHFESGIPELDGPRCAISLFPDSIDMEYISHVSEVEVPLSVFLAGETAMPNADDVDPVDLRTVKLAKRILFSTLVHLTEYRSTGAVICAATSRSRRVVADDSHLEYDLRLGIDVPDVRQAMRDYAAGVRGSPSVRSLVRGHYKRQAHGPNRSDRRLIWISPYWRGPDTLGRAARDVTIHVR
jgi:hypothetical protein